MSTLVTSKKKSIKTNVIVYAITTVFFFLFQLIYGFFSHEVSSYFMTYAFLIPLSGGVITTISLCVKESKCQYLFRQLINGAVIWLTLGSTFQGGLDIYGTTNKLIYVFVIVGVLQMLAAAITVVVDMFKKYS